MRSLLFSLALLVFWPVSAAADDPEPTRTALIEAARSYVAVVEADLRRELDLMARRLSVENEVRQVRCRLAEARHTLAVAENKPEEALAQLRLSLELCDKEVEQVRRLARTGTAAEAEVDVALRRREFLRCRLALSQDDVRTAVGHLDAIVGIGEREEQRAARLFGRGAALEGDVLAARRRIAYARYLKARIDEDPAAALKHARVVVAVRETEVVRQERLVAKGVAVRDDVDIARHDLLEARLRLAVVEEDAPTVTRLLDGLVEHDEGMLRRLAAHPEVGKAGQAALRLLLAEVRHRRVLAAEDYRLAAGEMYYELGR